MNHINRLLLEWKKISRKFYYMIILGLPTAVFMITCLVLLFKKQALIDQPIELIMNNNIGSWSALLYPFALLVIIQNLADVEHKNRLVEYAKSYKKQWFDFFAYKVVIALIILLLLTCLNVCYNALIYIIASDFMKVEQGNTLLQQTSYDFFKMILVFLPAIFFHLLLSLLIEKNGIVYIVGILFIITGIPIANLSDIMINPYSYGILTMKPSVSTIHLLVAGLIIMMISIFWFNYRLRIKYS